MCCKIISLTLLLCSPALLWADEPPPWRTRWDATLYGYGASNNLRQNSQLNPGNQLLRLPEQSRTGEMRLNLRAEQGPISLTLRPIAIWQQERNNFGQRISREGYISQGVVQWRLERSWRLAAGREVLHWGPGQFRSPGNPFYFDGGRSNPMRELSGLDMVKLSWTPDVHHGVQGVWLLDSGRNSRGQPDRWRGGWLLKADKRSEDWAAALALAGRPGAPLFAGGYWQQTVDDAWLIYGEASSSTLNPPPPDPAVMPDKPPRRLTALAGAAYTLENGQTFNVEYLRNNHGYGFDGVATAAYLSRLANLLALAPAQTANSQGSTGLLGRNYLHCVWQSNLGDDAGYWRLMFTRNLDDGSQELAGYGEYVVNNHLTAFVIALTNSGGAGREFSTLTTRSATVGLKVVLP